jgi:hypothetical protein
MAQPKWSRDGASSFDRAWHCFQYQVEGFPAEPFPVRRLHSPGKLSQTIWAGIRDGLILHGNIPEDSTLAAVQFLPPDEPSVIKTVQARGRLLAVSTNKGRFDIVRIDNGKSLYRAGAGQLPGSVHACHFYGERRLFACINERVYKFDLPASEIDLPPATILNVREETHHAHGHKVTAVAVSRGANPVMVTAGWDQVAQVFDLATHTSWTLNASVQELMPDVNIAAPKVTTQFNRPLRLITISEDAKVIVVAEYGHAITVFFRDESIPIDGVANPYHHGYGLKIDGMSDDSGLGFPTGTRFYLTSLSLCYSENLGTYVLAYGGTRSSLGLIDISTGRIIERLVSPSPIVHAVSLRALREAAHSLRLISAGSDGVIQVRTQWSDLEAWALVHAFLRTKGLDDDVCPIIQEYVLGANRQAQAPAL